MPLLTLKESITKTSEYKATVAQPRESNEELASSRDAVKSLTVEIEKLKKESEAAIEEKETEIEKTLK